MINQLIAMFLPSLLGLRKCQSLFTNNKEKGVLIHTYFLLVLFTNLISYLIVIYLFKEKYFEFTNLFTVKYIILNTVLAYVLPILTKFIKNYFNAEIVVKKNEK